MKPQDLFKKPGFPEIKLFPDKFEIKDRSHWGFRSFDFSEVSKIKYYNPNKNWWTQLLVRFSSIPTRIAYEQNQYRYLRVYKHSGGYWNYPTKNTLDNDFISILKRIGRKGDFSIEIK